MALTHNRDEVFIDTWVGMRREKNSVCRWTAHLGDEEFYLPIRHGEGRFVFGDSWQGKGVALLAAAGQIALRYSEDINGSAGMIAGICNAQGNVLGLMPHPECALMAGGSRLQGKRDSMGLTMIRGGVEFVKNS
jgi:phosphoribosylformylglycinamidine synthase